MILTKTGNQSILIVFYSFDGNTRFVAECIQKETKASLLELKLKNSTAPKGFLKYFWGGRQVLMKSRPPLASFTHKPNEYDLVIIGTPVWAWSCSPPVHSFFHNHPLTGNVAFFCCHAGSPGKALENMQAAALQANVISTIDFQEPLKQDAHDVSARVRQWISNDLIKQT